MSVKSDVLFYLEQERGKTVSGNELSKEIGVSRNAVFKAVNALREEGYDVLSSKSGYALKASGNKLSVAGIEKYLKEKRYNIQLYNEVESTNSIAKRLGEDGTAEWAVIIAESQTKGRGRLEKSFISPSGMGIYTSVLLRPSLPAEDVMYITVAAAVAAAKAIENNCAKKAEIKWVNDIYLDGKKVCGILTEASFDALSGKVSYAVLGIGINVAPPNGGFAAEISDIATAMLDNATADVRAKTVADFLDFFAEYYDKGLDASFDEYRKRQYLIGKDVEITVSGNKKSAKALGTDEKCRLVVKYPDGGTEAISFGDVSAKSMSQS